MPETSSIRPQRDNPFIRETAEMKYANTVNELARSIIYDERLSAPEMEKTLRSSMRKLDYYRFEKDQHEFEALLHLLRGVEMHERANLYHNGAWQAALLRQETRGEHPPKPSETLTREEVAREFDAFVFKQELIEAEEQAVTEYQRLLELKADAEIQLSKNIRIGRTDIEVLLIDLKTRITERIADPKERRTQLESLDRELAQIIQRIPVDDRGKRFEIEEVYLLRRLIHATDNGHLASVSHGTPRDDLRLDRGSVDIEVTAAGDVIRLQLKTFKYGVSGKTRAKQTEIYELAKARLQESGTHLVVLEAEAVQDTYEASLRQPKGTATSRADKFAALSPISHDLQPHERSRLLALIGLTETDLAQEQEELQRKQQEWETLYEQKRAEKLAEEERNRQAIAERAKQEQEKQQAEEARLAAIAAHERLAAEAAATRLRSAAETAAEKQRLINEKLAEAARRDAEQKELARREADAAAAAEARRQKRMEKQSKEASKDWPPKSLAGLVTAPLLKKLGILPDHWQGDVAALLAAKKRFINALAQPRRGATEVTEQDKPSDRFKIAFPTKESLTSPTDEDIERFRSLKI